MIFSYFLDSHFESYGEFVELITMQDAMVLRLALTNIGSAGSANYIKIGDGKVVHAVSSCNCGGRAHYIE